KHELLSPASDGWMRLRAGTLPKPCATADADKAERLYLGFTQIGAPVFGSARTSDFCARLRSCADEIGVKTSADARASLELLDLASGIGDRETTVSLTAEENKLRK